MRRWKKIYVSACLCDHVCSLFVFRENPVFPEIVGATFCRSGRNLWLIIELWSRGCPCTNFRWLRIFVELSVLDQAEGPLRIGQFENYIFAFVSEIHVILWFRKLKHVGVNGESLPLKFEGTPKQTNTGILGFVRNWFLETFFKSHPSEEFLMRGQIFEELGFRLFIPPVLKKKLQTLSTWQQDNLDE